jgi:hypothetical protein
MNYNNANNRIQDPDLDKSLNSKCFCTVGLPWKETEVVMAYPCEHMFHESCYIELSDKKRSRCPLCRDPILRIFHLLDDGLHPQRFADILSVTHYSDMSSNDTFSFIDSIFDIASVLTKLPFLKGEEGGMNICEKLCSLNNLTLKVHGMEKLKLEKNKVFIANHTSYIEFFVIFYLFKTGYLASSMSGESHIVQQAKKVIPLLTVTRGEKNRDVNVIDAMRDFVDDKGSICLFPEGMMSHPDSLVRFRTGAFHINRPIYAIAIRYIDIVSDGYVNKLLYKISGKKDLNLEVHVLGPYYPPFSPQDIDNIRADMAYHGKMVLSRVSNRDVNDTDMSNKKNKDF